MNRKLRRIAAVTVAAVLGLTGVAEAKTYKVNVLGHGGQKGVDLFSTYKGKPFGTCKMTGKLVIPHTTQRWKCSHGSFTVIGLGTTGAADHGKGTWKIKRGSGTGRYKGITGKGTFDGFLHNGTFRYKGTAKY